MAFLSGLWMPLTMLPSIFTQIAPLWPSYHLSQLAQMAIGIEPWSGAGIHVAWVLAESAVCFAIARRWMAKAA